MVKVKKISRLKADSVLEVVIAAVLVVVIFGIAMMVYSNVLRTSRPVKQVRAAAILKSMAIRIEQQRDTLLADTAAEGLTITRRVRPSGTKGTVDLQLVATGVAGDTLAVFNKVILSDHE